jgi:site-specific DNA-methyltransferase (adenine-specific)
MRQIIEPINQPFEEVVQAVADYQPKNTTVFSHKRDAIAPKFTVDDLPLDTRIKMDGLTFLKKLPNSQVPLVFFDPQYRSVLDRQSYGNEGEQRGKKRTELPQMDNKKIHAFIHEIERVLMMSGHLMLWVDKYIVCNGVQSLMEGSALHLVDMITWDKQRMGMGYRTRRHSEYLVIFQKLPIRAKGIWHIHDIPDVWPEKIENGHRNHTHAKPVNLQKRLIQAVTNPGDVVVDPSAGGFSVMESAIDVDRHFLGCDILG